MTRQNSIQEYAQSIGIADIGFCDAKLNIGYANFIKERKQATKSYLDVDYKVTTSETYDPSIHLDQAKTIIALIYPYHMDFSKKDQLQSDEVRISKASIFTDYHASVLKQCHQLETYLQRTYAANTKAYSDMGPLNDKSILLRTGLVKIGRNSLLIHPKFGSRFYIGYILTDLDMGIETKGIESFDEYQRYFHPFCQTCGRCARSCPNHAIQTFGRLTSKRCISFLTQSKGWNESLNELDNDLTLDSYVYGCDTCQRVCPLNGIPLDAFDHEGLVEPNQKVNNLLSLSNRGFKEKFGQTSTGWIGNKRFKRNIYQIQKEREGK